METDLRALGRQGSPHLDRDLRHRRRPARAGGGGEDDQDRRVASGDQQVTRYQQGFGDGTGQEVIVDTVTGKDGSGHPLGLRLLHPRGDPRSTTPRRPTRGRDERVTDVALVVGREGNLIPPSCGESGPQSPQSRRRSRAAVAQSCSRTKSSLPPAVVPCRLVSSEVRGILRDLA